MKKWIALLLTLALALSLSVTAFAAETAEITEQDGNPTETAAKITTSIKPTYTVIIPKDVQVEFNETSAQFGAIELTAARIEPGYAVKVKLDAGGKLVNEADETRTIAYTINSDGKEFSSGEYQNKGESTGLTIDITQEAWDAAYAGDYSDTVTFTISYGKVMP